MGLGWRSYTAALRTLVEIVRESRESAGSMKATKATRGQS
jgi:hypothetical protein